MAGQGFRRWLLLASLLGLWALAGCLPQGKLTVTNSVTVHPYGPITQAVELRASGLFAKSLRLGTGEWADLQRIEHIRGWKVEKRMKGEAATLGLSRTFDSFAQFQAGNMHRVASEVSRHYPFRPGRVSLRTRNYGFVRYYDYQEHWQTARSDDQEVCSACQGTGKEECTWCQGTGRDPVRGGRCAECGGRGTRPCTDCGGTGKPSGMQSALLALAREAINNRMRANYRIRMPGVITESNADHVVDNTAAWSCGLLDLEQGRTLQVSSRYVDWWVIVGAVLLMLALVGTYVVLHARLVAVASGRHEEPPPE